MRSFKVLSAFFFFFSIEGIATAALLVCCGVVLRLDVYPAVNLNPKLQMNRTSESCFKLLSRFNFLFSLVQVYDEQTVISRRIVLASLHSVNEIFIVMERYK